MNEEVKTETHLDDTLNDIKVNSESVVKITTDSILNLEASLKDAMLKYFEMNEGVDYSITMPIALDIMLRFPHHWIVSVFGRTEDELRKAVNQQLDIVITTAPKISNNEINTTKNERIENNE